MFAIIYWVNDFLGEEETYPYPVLNVPTLYNEGKTLKLFETLKEADKWAFRLEKKTKVEARVISIEGVKE